MRTNIRTGLNPSRRRFLMGAGGLTFGLVIGADGIRLVSEAHASAARSVNAWVRIAPDGAVTILSAGAEMGQGSMTSLPLIVAEEMDADFARVRIRQAYLDQKFGRMGTGGSGSVRSMWTPLRTAGATARAMLVGAAAAKLGVAANELTVDRGVISHASGRKLKFGDVAEAAAGAIPLLRQGVQVPC